jgi:minor extracellular serine protease Vpr
MQLRRSRLAVLALAVALILVVPAAGSIGPDVSHLALDEPATAHLGGAPNGQLTVFVKLKGDPLAVAAGPKQQSRLSPAQQRAHVDRLAAAQDRVAAQLAGLGATEVARLTKALNGLIVSVDASRLDAIASLTDVAGIDPVVDHELDLSETVGHIGAAAVQAAGNTGEGVRVAVIDSGIDYTHASMGGAGTAAAYEAAYGTSVTDPRNTTRDGLFPTDKVVEGWDFVGEAWPSGPLAPNEDPIDCGPSAIPAPCAGGHGTNVADIIAGVGPDPGVAPGAELLAYKACSAVSTSCSGVAMLMSIEASLDPNGDGSMDDAADIINMSIGASYGQKENATVGATANAVKAGVVVTVSAGNSADRPYITGSPSSTPEAISVAQTQVPSAGLLVLIAGPVTAPMVHQPWSSPPVFQQGELVYDATNAGTRQGCSTADGANPWVGTPFTGKIVLVDRGLCAVSLKMHNVAAAGGIAAVVANNVAQAPGDLPPSFSFGGGTLFIPTYTITLADGNALKASSLGQTATIDPAGAPLVLNMVPTSSRGPDYSFNAIKPDLGAPGASLSAAAGSGTGNRVFGGTSGAAPMVAGSAALLLSERPSLTPGEVKSLLMNTGERNIGINPLTLPGYPAPITRIGGGEVRADKALASMTAAWDRDWPAASLSFGFHAVHSSANLNKTVVVRNYGSSARTYAISNEFRYQDDADSGAVTLTHPASITVPANSSRTFNVRLGIDASKLPVWSLNGGSRGGDGYRLQDVEFDGYLKLDGGANNNVAIPWQVMPRRSANVAASSTDVTLTEGTGAVTLSNAGGAVSGGVEVFSLTGTSDRIGRAFLPGIGDHFAVVDLKAVGVRQAGANIQFAVHTFGARSHPNYPAQFRIWIDSNRDGVDDRLIFTTENGGFAATGQNAVAVANPPFASGSLFFFSDVDLNSSHSILTAPLSALGLTAGTQFDFRVEVSDNYFTGLVTDSIGTMTYRLDTPKYAASAGTLAIPAGGSAPLGITAVAGGDTASPSQTGLLAVYRNARLQREAELITVTP